jgi:peptidoglycan/LPS O-acetylase OafA/YrhL
LGVTLTSAASASTTAPPSTLGTVDGTAPALDAPTDFAPQRFGYLPALDGLRAIAVLAVMAFHAGFAVASGGVLGVSTFFTLSGFLIASLSLGERASTGRLSLPAFWERRARRLLPASLVTLAGIVVLQWAAHIGSGPSFRGDLYSTLGYATNWRLAARGGDYAQLFAAPSPLTHFWSLAIEEQFYLLFPLAFVGLMAAFRRRPLRAGWVFAAAAVASFALAAWTADRSGNSGLAYYGTHTRAGELLVGVCLGFLVANRRVRAALGSRLGAPVVRYGSLAALAGLAGLWSWVTLGDTHLFKGLTLLNAALTAVVVLACVRDDGPMRLALGNWPLRMVGKVSYAAYLIHWPLFLFVDAERFDLAPRPLFVVRVILTLTLATVSYWVVEYPFRRRLQGLPRPRLAMVLAGGAASVAVLTGVVPVHASGDVSLDLGGPPPGAAPADFDGDGYQFGTRMDNKVMPVDGNPSVADVLLMGDSVAWSLMPGFAGWNENHPDQNVTLDTHLSFGCPLSGPGDWMGPRGRTPTWPDCSTWLPDMPKAFDRSQPDVIVMTMGLGDVGGRKVEGKWRSFGDPVFDDWFRDKLAGVADMLASAHTDVVWLTYPDIRVANADDPTADPDDMEINDPRRVDALNAMVRDELAGRPGFRVVDLNGWVRSWPSGEFDRDLRDGVHFTLGGSAIADEFVVPQALAAMNGQPAPTPPPGP